MKQITYLIFIAILLAACSPSNQNLVNSWQEALNKGRVNEALSYLAEDAKVTIIPPAEGDGVYNGHSEIRGWYETIASGKGSGSLKDCKSVSDSIACISTYTDEGLKAMGVDFIEGEWVATIENGKIQAYTFTTSQDSLAKFPPPIPTPVESLVNTINELVGTWWYPQGRVKIEFNADGTGRVISGSENIGQIDSGTYNFESGKVTFVTSTACHDQTATYEAYVTTENNKPISLRMQVIGIDPCEDRVKVLAGIGKFYNP
ncbi:MAG: nuclear transport factor 2 family protein [Syntrophaceae bacterium]|nr:nuclear transport factor 2 family protein [Syntrophaceae bacterium]